MHASFFLHIPALFYLYLSTAPTYPICPSPTRLSPPPYLVPPSPLTKFPHLQPFVIPTYHLTASVAIIPLTLTLISDNCPSLVSTYCMLAAAPPFSPNSLYWLSPLYFTANYGSRPKTSIFLPAPLISSSSSPFITPDTSFRSIQIIIHLEATHLSLTRSVPKA